MQPLTRSERERSKRILAELALNDDEYRQYRARQEQFVEAASIADRDVVLPAGEDGVVCRPRLWTSPIFSREFVIFDLQRECSDPAPMTMDVPGGACILVPNAATSSNIVDLELIRLHQAWRRGEGRWKLGPGGLSPETAVDAFFGRFGREADAYLLHLAHYPATEVDLSCEELALGNALSGVLGDALVARLVEPEAVGLLLAAVITQAGPQTRALGYASRSAEFVTKYVGAWTQRCFEVQRAHMDASYVEAVSEFFRRALALGGGAIA